MKWLAILLMLSGFGPSQASQLAAIVQSLWITGAFFPGGTQSFLSWARHTHRPVDQRTALDLGN